MNDNTLFGKPVFLKLRLSVMEAVLLGAMTLVLLMTSLDALEGNHVGKGNALELARQQGHQSIIAQRPVK